MADVDDPHGFERKVEKQIRKIEEAEAIDECTTEDLIDFAKAYQAGRVPDEDEVSDSTLKSYLVNCRIVASSIEEPLTENPLDAIHDFIQDIKYQYKASTYNLYVNALVKFGDYHDLGWKSEFERQQENNAKVDTNRLFTDAEVNRLLEVGQARDQAIVSLFADTAVRIGALLSFRIRDLDLDSKVPQLSFNTGGPTKTASGKVLLSWSTGHLRSYLSTDHPRPNTPEAPIIHKKEAWEEGDGALHPDTLRWRLNKTGENANIARERMKPHNFRHTAISNWIRQGFTPQEIVHRASWASPKMLKIYDNVTDEQKNKDIAIKMGLVEDDDLATDPSEATIDCPQCGTPVRRNANYCSECKLPMSQAPVFEQKNVDQGMDEDGPDTSQKTDQRSRDNVDIDLEDVPIELLAQEIVEREGIDPSELVNQ